MSTRPFFAFHVVHEDELSVTNMFDMPLLCPLFPFLIFQLKHRNAAERFIVPRCKVEVDDVSLVVIAVKIDKLCDDVNPAAPNPTPLGLLSFGITFGLFHMKTTGLGGTTATDLAGDDTHFMGIACVQLTCGECQRVPIQQ